MPKPNENYTNKSVYNIEAALPDIRVSCVYQASLSSSQLHLMPNPYKPLEVVIESALGLENVNHVTKMKPYVVVYIWDIKNNLRSSKEISLADVGHKNSNISILNRVYNILHNQSTTTKGSNLLQMQTKVTKGPNFHVYSNSITVYSKKKQGCLSHISCVCLMFVVYNFSLQLQMLDPFVVELWLCNVL